MKYIFIPIFLLLTVLFGYSQTNSFILGTFSIGCKIFNYEVNKMHNGIHTIKFEDFDSDANKIFLNYDTISLYKARIDNIINNVDNYSLLLGLSEPEKAIQNEAIIFNLTKCRLFLDTVQQGSVRLNYWNFHKDSIQLIFQNLDSLNINEYDSIVRVSDPGLLFNDLTSRIENIYNQYLLFSKSKEYSLYEFNQENFKYLFLHFINNKSIYFLPECSSKINSSYIETLALGIFYEIKTKLEFNDDEPITSIIKLKDRSINCYFSNNTKIGYKSIDEGVHNIPFLIDKVSIEFEDGNIKNLFADMYMIDSLGNPIYSSLVSFKNTIPIPIASRNSIDNFSKFKIYNTDFGSILHDTSFVNAIAGYTDTVINSKSNGNIYFLLSNLLAYFPVLESDKEDYSPVNSVVILNNTNTFQELKKIKRSKILSVKAYTDFIGVQDDQPNGLIQIEASRKFNLTTKKNGNKNIYMGWVHFIEPKLTISKIEENNNSLFLTSDNIDEDFLKLNQKVFNVEAIDLLKYQNTAFDLDMNLYKINFPNIKSNIQFNINVGLLRTSVTDSIIVSEMAVNKSNSLNSLNLSSLRVGESIMLEIKPDNRYGFNLGFDLKIYSSLNTDYIVGISTSSLIYSFWADAFLKTGINNTLFFRYKLSYSPYSSIPDYSFTQIQLGYLLDIFKTTK